jgi:hypothetical protein
MLIPQVRIFVPSKKQFLDRDHCELLKINWFINHLSKIKKVAILMPENLPLKAVEKWPIIQSYGQSDLDRGFFSMDHELMNMVPLLDQVYKNYDGFGL